QAGHAAASIAGSDAPLAALSLSYRTWATSNPGLYTLMSAGPLPTDDETTRAADRGIAVLRDLFDGNREHARWFYVAAHGLVLLEINGRTPPDWELDSMWTQLADRARLR
ncbi:MAG: WHG domain-containing protein, partial [Thermoleophilia bacterium]|nr:WHG domain-containing protein [Thermoleophilia bacterium]